MALLTMMLLPFMMSSQTSFLSNNAIAAMFNCALKVCVIAFLSVVGMKTLGRYFDSFKASIQALDASNFTALLIQFDITVLVLLFLVWKMPQLVQGLLHGQPQFGAGQMVSMVASGASTVAGGVGLATGAAATVAAKSGTTVGGQMMSAMSNTFSGVKDMAFGDMKGGFSKLSEAGKNAMGTASQAGKVASTAVTNGLDNYMFNSQPRQSYGAMRQVGEGNTRGLSDQEISAGAVSKNLEGHVVYASNKSDSSPDGTNDETRNVEQKVQDHVSRKHELQYEDSGPIEHPSGQNGQDYTVEGKPGKVFSRMSNPLILDQFNNGPKA